MNLSIFNEPNNWNYNLTLNSEDILIDSIGRKWNIENPIKIQIEKKSQLFFPLSFKTNFQNAFQISNNISNDNCPNDCFCCESQCFSLSQNDSIFYLFDIFSPLLIWTTKIHVNQQDKIWDLNLEIGGEQKNINNSISAQIKSDNLNPIYSQFENFFLAIQSENLSLDNEPFLIPKNEFNNSVNKIGISKEKYIEKQTCPPKDLISVMNGSIHNQLSKFQNNFISSQIGCYFNQNLSSLDPLKSSTFSESFICDNISSDFIQITMEIGSTGLSFTKEIPQIKVIDSGIQFINQTSGILFIDVENEAIYNGTIEIQPRNCCLNNLKKTEDETGSEFIVDCSAIQIGSSISKSITSKEVINFRFNLNSNSTIDQEGNCTYAILQNGRLDSVHEIGFGTNDPNDIFSKGFVMNSNNPICTSPSREVTLGGAIRYCQPACTEDQEFNETTQSCIPVNCSSKYFTSENKRDFYNPQTGLCEPFKECSGNEILNYISNVCLDSNTNNNSQYVETWSDFEAEDVYTGNISDFLNNTYADCGSHGKLTEDNTSCICDKGFTNGLDSNGVFQWCRNQIPNLDTQKPSVFQSLNWSLIGITFGLILCCVFCCCRKRIYRCCCRKKRKIVKLQKMKNNEKEKLIWLILKMKELESNNFWKRFSSLNDLEMNSNFNQKKKIKFKNQFKPNHLQNNSKPKMKNLRDFQKKKMEFSQFKI
ncbi:hypothetical protein M0811_12309 [Anaeramoeba ignava]|uniref:Uncharacterized protein n=1 Tax=Anaeramoeba ignava TaxID=1746090 RepID=A0A9Q0L8N9_ANAIG|nr:hypothetical protein M0811_12309 [Anaeramoeba ignava]